MSFSLHFIVSLFPSISNLTFIIDFQSNKGYFIDGRIQINELFSKQYNKYNTGLVSKTEFIRKFFQENIISHQGLNEDTLCLNIPEEIYSKLIINNKYFQLIVIITNFKQDYFLDMKPVYNNLTLKSNLITVKSKNSLRNNHSNQIFLFTIDNLIDYKPILIRIIKNSLKKYSFKQEDESNKKHNHHNLSYKTNSFSEISKGSNNVFDALLNILILMCFCWDCYQCFSTPNDQVNQAMQGRDNILFSE